MKLSFGIDRILSSPSSFPENGFKSPGRPAYGSVQEREEEREKCHSATSTAAFPICFLPSYPSSFLAPAAAVTFDDKWLQHCHQLLVQTTSQRQEEMNNWKSNNLSIFDDYMIQSCGLQRQADFLSCSVSLQSKHQQQQQRQPSNMSFVTGAGMRNEEVSHPYCHQVPSAGSSSNSSIRADHVSKRLQSMKKIRDEESQQQQPIINRSVFSKLQREGLEEAFAKTKYITKQQRVMLAQELKLKDFQVKIWFQNRRSKWRNSDN